MAKLLLFSLVGLFYSVSVFSHFSDSNCLAKVFAQTIGRQGLAGQGPQGTDPFNIVS